MHSTWTLYTELQTPIPSVGPEPLCKHLFPEYTQAVCYLKCFTSNQGQKRVKVSTLENVICIGEMLIYRACLDRGGRSEWVVGCFTREKVSGEVTGFFYSLFCEAHPAGLAVKVLLDNHRAHAYPFVLTTAGYGAYKWHIWRNQLPCILSPEHLHWDPRTV